MAYRLDAPIDLTFSALAHPARRAILRRLAFKEASVSDLAIPFHMSLQAISKHLRILEKAKLISKKTAGRERIVYLNKRALREAYFWLHDFV